MIEGRRRNHGRKCGLVSFNPHVASSPSRIPLLHLLFKTIFDLRVFNPVPDSSTNAAENGQNKKTRKENQESGNRICKIESLNYIQPWWEWAYWASPMMYGQNAIAINEFLDPRWNTPNNDSSIDALTVGKAIFKSRGMFVDDSWYWICIGALIGFSFMFNACFILALTYLKSLGNSQHVLIEMNADLENENQSSTKDIDVGGKRKISKVEIVNANDSSKKGMVLPFQPLSLAFHHVNYYVDMPAVTMNLAIWLKEKHSQVDLNIGYLFDYGWIAFWCDMYLLLLFLC